MPTLATRQFGGASRALVDSSPAEFSALTDVPLFLGYISSFLLQGILVAQVFVYYVLFPHDSRYMKVLVGFVFFLECLSSVFATVAALTSLIRYGDLFDLSLLWSFRALAPLCGLATLIVHTFYVWRIWVLGSRGRWILLPAFIFALSIAQCAMVMVSGFTSTLGAGTETEVHPRLLAINIVWLAGSALCDVMIAGTLVWLLRRASSKAETLGAKCILKRIITLTVETGLITAIGAFVELLFFLVFRNSFIHFILFYMLPKIYANCMMASINSRLMLPGREFRCLETPAPSLRQIPSRTSVYTMSYRISQLSRYFTTTRHEESDPYTQYNRKPLPRIPKDSQ